MPEPAETIAVDVHAHLVPIRPDRLAPMPGVVWDAAERRLSVDGHAIGIRALYEPAALLDWMDRNRVGRALVSAPPPTYREQLRGADATAWARYLTDGLREIAAGHPGRLAPLAHLPIQDAAAAIEIAEGEIASGHSLFSSPTGVPGAALSDAAYEPLWSRLSEAEAFVFLHPGRCADGRLSSFYLENLVGNPHETGIAGAHLLMSGALGRFPGIRFCLAHCGGTLAALAGRLRRGLDTERPGTDGTVADVGQLRGVMVDCIAHDPGLLALARSVFGEENVVFGSDWPFPMGLPEPHGQLAALDPADRARIYAGEAVLSLSALSPHKEV